ncbi:MAG TPA: YfiR family protein, partial [Bryobacteraceae bacterium]|nr:YfiR family protein [Bryobacteraceae bacterium]
RGLGLALLLLTPQAAAQQRPLEDEVKAAFLLNFTKFVEWPASAFLDNSTPISLCILGEGPVADTLAHLVQDERAHGRAIAVKTVKAPGPSDGCHVLFIARSEKDVRTLLAGVRPGVLTVGESDSFIAEGGMIKFVVENRRVRFDISQAKAARAMLAVNGRLLNVARVVEK